MSTARATRYHKRNIRKEQERLDACKEEHDAKLNEALESELGLELKRWGIHAQRILQLYMEDMDVLDLHYVTNNDLKNDLKWPLEAQLRFKKGMTSPGYLSRYPDYQLPLTSLRRQWLTRP